MIYEVIVAPPAEEDLRRNANWWARHHSTEQSGQWFQYAYEQLDTLKKMPQRCPLSAENNLFAFEIRDFLFGLGSRPSYRAIFTIEEDKVYVLRVLRGAQDSLLPGDIEVS